ncbi:outer membrane protein [Nonlabens dokdonensis]|jgi:outer membrane protein|uniref:Outer membrane protein beta-barrel domain-containing protein n=2 Tax=Nonlabens dokdonensis TaxID=328515 RepID=L7WBM2_NONDD|nr:OmpW family outer membrane protein [Nonlabens dokdonensis]AGC77276.1 hypothetical protein DDD_2149 [Nonlabens dokdonensis DSW-6]PZX40811.1 outer membrane protein [Nonlabens dokdonensis]
MKKLLLAAIAIATMGITNAQTEKGKWTFGGSTTASFASNTFTPEFNGTEGEESTISEFTFTPNAGYFVMDNLAVGIDLSYTSSKEEQNGFDFTTNTIALLPNATYFFEAGDNFKPFVSAGAGLISSSFGDDDSDKFSGFAFTGEAGVAYFINSNVSLDFMVRYLNATLSNKENDDFKNKNSALGVGIGFSIFL